MSNYKMLRTPLLAEPKGLFAAGRQTLTVVSPFVNRYGLERLEESIQQTKKDVRISILTCLSVKSLSAGSLDIHSLAEFCGEFPTCRVCNLPGLHAKVYIADHSEAIVTSANLTYGGLEGNYEYGILITDTTLVASVQKDMNEYANLGARLNLDDLLELANEVRELRSATINSEKAFRASPAWKRLSGKIRGLQKSLLRQRIRGTSVNSIFAETVRYLLRSGPMTTQALEARVQATHPDMCDDTIDRVIDGVRFGKKWKHMVRNTQQFLKKRSEIEFHAGMWRLAT